MTDQASQPVLFASTGVQILSFPLEKEIRKVDLIGRGWQRCRCSTSNGYRDYHYIQWQIIAGVRRLFVAVDTTLARQDSPDDHGYFCKEGMLADDFHVDLSGLVGVNDMQLEGVPEVQFSIRSALTGGSGSKDVHLVVDFGNNRTGGLLVEAEGHNQEPRFEPLMLLNRFGIHSNAWNGDGDIASDPGNWWFSSRSIWSTPPFLAKPVIQSIDHKTETVRKMLRKTDVTRAVTTERSVDVFRDISQLRMGKEAFEVSLMMRDSGIAGACVMDLSSPKRYLWAGDSGWLAGAKWYMSDPYKTDAKGLYIAPLKGEFLRFFSPTDDPDDEGESHDELITNPIYPPRMMMAGALYEILVQAYRFINSPGYMKSKGYHRRILRTLVLSYPSGMVYEERKEFKRQAERALSLFHRTVGLDQRQPDLHFSIDEASAAHLTYMWAEIQKLQRYPQRWFELMGKNLDRESTDPVHGQATEPKNNTNSPELKSDHSSNNKKLPTVRIACIDIGGGTSDLMIAKYQCYSHAGGAEVTGEILHRDGLSIAGDHLVRRILERIIVPHFENALNLESHVLRRLFGLSVEGENEQIRRNRAKWMRHLLIPLAQRYLKFAVDNNTVDSISHTDGELIAPEIVAGIQEQLNREYQVGEYQFDQELQLYYDQSKLDEIIQDEFAALIKDFCGSIAEQQADIVLLAGLPTKLEAIRKLALRYLPLPPSRVISMYRRYVGEWYPYQNREEQGVIEDPKSTVVVGSAIEFLAKRGFMRFKFKMDYSKFKESYYWGTMDDGVSRINKVGLLFTKNSANLQNKDNIREIKIISTRLKIGRKRRPQEDARATPVYVIKVDAGSNVGEIDFSLKIRRVCESSGHGDHGEEKLMVEPDSIKGQIGDAKAIFGQNVFFALDTLADDEFFLDKGGLNVESRS